MSYSSMTTSQRLRVDAICMSYNNIGLAYKALSEYSKAIYHHRICIERFESFYGDAPREDLARYIDNFGCAYYSNGEYNEAIKCHLKALIMIDTLGSPSAIVGQIIYNLAISILELGKEQSKTNQTKLQASSLKVDIGQGNSKALINKAIDLFKCTKAIFKDDLILKKIEEYIHTCNGVLASMIDSKDTQEATKPISNVSLDDTSLTDIIKKYGNTAINK